MKKIYLKGIIAKFLIILVFLILTGCGNLSEQTTISNNESVTQSNISNEDDVTQATNTDATTEYVVSGDDITTVNSEESITNEDVTNTSVKDYVSEFDASFIPAYQGDPYCEINDNSPFFTESEFITDSFETYSPLDSLGRCGMAYANVCEEIMPTEERGEIGNVKPSGWHTVKYDCISDLYLYNRCHLIGFQLAGENANELNLITGTRYMNVTGMLPFENEVDNYVENTGNHVLYRVTPVFIGDNLVAEGVLMEAASVEDESLRFNVFVYNVQPGVIIDYATGESWEDDAYAAIQVDTTTEAIMTTDEQVVEPTEDTSYQQMYILNTNTGKFHYPSCSSVSQMNENNKQQYTGLRDELINMGFSPCERCCP